MLTRRIFLQSASAFTAALANSRWVFSLAASVPHDLPLEEFGYEDVTVTSEIHQRQLNNTHSVLMNLSEDSLLKPFRKMVGQPAPGAELGGWYLYDPNYDWHTFAAGFAPAATFGQWVSALARTYSITHDNAIREKVLRLNQLYAKTIAPDFYRNNRFPAYCYDKLVCGLIDSHKWAGDPDAFRILEHTSDTALPLLPGKAIEHGTSWRPGTDESYTWDESYTISENLFLAYQRGAGERYRKLGEDYLDDAYYGALSEGRSNLSGRHAYSHVNSLCSAAQAYLTLGSAKHLAAAKNGFDMVLAQSYATGGWGPDETLRAPGSDDVLGSLTSTHNSFETPCGAYAHFKLTRYLLRITGQPRYGDSMERVMYNTILGAKPLQSDGRTFYYADCNFKAKKVYSDHRWPCCSGTMPQIAADYGISAYFRGPTAVYVNLYLPSSVRWNQDGAQICLKQVTSYPFDSHVQFEITASREKEFQLNFRVPAWASGASLSVNGKRQPNVTPGTFAAIRRQWKNGDRVELNLPLLLHLEPVDARHPKTVALLSGPVVLFGITDQQPKLTEQQLLRAQRTNQQNWKVETGTRTLTLLPFTQIAEETYTTYFQVES